MYYKNNLELLRDYNPLLELDLLNVDTDSIEYLSNEDEIIFKLTDDLGNEFYTGSIYNPKYEVECFLEKINMDNTGYLILGLSNSYLLKRLADLTIETAWTIIVEPNPKVLKKFLEIYDLSKIINEHNNRLIFITGSIENIRKNFLLNINSLVGYYFVSPEIIRTFTSTRVNTEQFDEIFELFKDVVVNFAFNTGNDLDDTLLGIKNEIRNLPYVFNRPNLKNLKGILNGRKVICVSSGPSLDKQLPLLKKVQGKAVIICAESAFKALLAHDIEPDIVCILERGENSLHFSIEGAKIPNKTYLFGLTIIEPKIYEKWGERAIPCFKDNLTFSNELHERLGDFGKFPSGNSVAHFNLMLAEYLGAEDIILIGQDLAFSDSGEHHSKSTPYAKLNEKEEEKYGLIPNDNDIVYLDGYFGGKVKSKKLWKQFLIWFEILLKQVQANVINSTEGGAIIKGTTNRPFLEIVKDLEGKEDINFSKMVDQYSNTTAKINKNQIFNAINEFIVMFENIYKEVRIQKDSTKKLLKLIEVFNVDELLDDIKETLSNNEMKIFRKILNNKYLAFYFAPVIIEMHIRVNPISRISDKRRLQEILLYQILAIEKIEKYAQKYLDTVSQEHKNLCL